MPTSLLTRSPRTYTAIAILALVAWLMLFMPSNPAHAQDTTVVTLVSNAGESGTSLSVSSTSVAQSFTTGSHSAGYTLTAVDFPVGSQTNQPTSIRIYTTSSSGAPNAELYTLVRPDSISGNSTNTATAPENATLDPNTTYAVVFEIDLFIDLFVTSSNDEDTKQTGWSLWDKYHSYNSTTMTWSEISGGSALQVTVKGKLNPNSQPVFSSDTATRTLQENSGADVNVGAPVTATDANTDDTLNYVLTGTHASSFVIDSTSGQIKTKEGITYDFEGTNPYSVTVNVLDNKNASGDADSEIDDSIVVTINLTNVNEPPERIDGTTVATVPENTATTTLLLTFEGVDPDANTTFTWSLEGTDAGSFNITRNSDGHGEIRFKNVPDYESPADIDGTDSLGNDVDGEDNVYYIDVKVSDGSLSFVLRDVTVTVTNVNEPPTIAAGGNTINVDENTSTTTVLYTYSATDPEQDGNDFEWVLSGDDSGDFNITENSDGEGELTFDAVPNYEDAADTNTNNEYKIRVTVRDGASGSATREVTVNVRNKDEAGTVTITGTPTGGSTLSATLTDPDGSITSTTWRWQRADSAMDTFTNISGATSSTYTLVAADVGKVLRVTVSYTDGHSSGKSATSSATSEIGSNNNEPSFSAETATRTVPENSAAGTNVGSAVTATDSDSGATLTYSLAGTDANSFTIVSTSGQIQTKSGVTYNFEANKNSYTVIVWVRDNRDTAGDADTANDDSITVTINLTDVNEAPVITTPHTTRSVPENSTAVITLMASDVDASDSKTWSVESADDGSFFEITQDGALSFTNAPDFENPQDAGTNNVYNVTVKVTDSGNLTDTHSIAVTVTNVNEPPVIDSGPSSFSKDENTPTTEVIATYVASDVDGDDSPANLSWTLRGEDANDFRIAKNSSNDAELKFRNVPDYENPADDDDMDSEDGDNVYEVTIRVTDDGGSFDEIDVMVTVNDLNETPVISGSSAENFAEIEYDEDVTSDVLEIATYSATDDDGDSVTWDVSGTDADSFTISASGVLSFNFEPDFENPEDMADSQNMGADDNVYEIVVEADDGQGGTGIEESVGTFTVAVTVTNVDETPEITTKDAGRTAPSFAEIEWDATTANLQIGIYIARDEEDGIDGIEWSLAGADAGDFSISTDINSGFGTLSFRNRPNFEDPKGTPATPGSDPDNTYEITVRASDITGSTKTAELPVVVTVTNINERPEFTVTRTNVTLSEIAYDSGTTVNDLRTIAATTANQLYWYAFEARDEEGNNITWSLTGTDAPDLEITEDSSFISTDNDERAIVRWNIVPNFEDPKGQNGNTYVYTVRASDGSRSSTYNHQLTITNINERPFFRRGSNSHSLDEHNSTLDSNFEEPPYTFPTILTYEAFDQEGGVTWSLTGADAGDFDIDSGGNVSFKQRPSFEHPQDSGGNNVYNFNVVATDVMSGSTRLSASRAVTVTVRDIEETGVVTVSNLDPVVGDTITFTLSDPDGSIVQTAGQIDWDLQVQDMGVWSAISNFSDSSTVTLNYTVDEDIAGKRLRARVRYFDNRNADRQLINQKLVMSAATEPVLADPSPNVPPRFRSGTSHSIDEGVVSGFLPEPLRATDRDGDTLTYGLGQAGNIEYFEVNSSTGQISIIQELNYEDFLATNGLVTASVTLSDGKGVDDMGTTDPADDTEINDSSVDVTASLSVQLIDLEEEGVVSFNQVEPEVGISLIASVEDGDSGVTGTSWQWARSSNGRTGWSNISSATSATYTPTENDEDQFLRARVTYTDRRGGGKSAEGITSPVPSENRRPLFPSTETGQRSVDENSRSGTNIGEPVAAIDHENNSLRYSLTGTDADSFSIVTSTGQIRVKDALDFEMKSSYSVTVEVHDGRDSQGNSSTTIDDTQDVTITVQNVDEPGIVTLSSITGTIQARVPITASLSDDDGVIGSVDWQWARSMDGRTGWVNISAATTDIFLPNDADQGRYVRATASYDDGEGSNKTAEQVSPRIGQPPPVNSPPSFPATETGRREIAEDASGGTEVGDPVSAMDLNNDTLIYTLSGTDAGSFTIGENNGQLSLAAGAELDFETKRSYNFTVEVSDGADALDDPDNNAIDARRNVTVNVTNVNEAPVVTGDEMPSLPENSNQAIATYTGTDPERDTLTWSVSSDDFWISATGRLHFAEPPSYEGGATRSVTITAADPDGLQDSLDITVTLTDVEEEGVVTITPPRGWVDVSTQFSAALTDDDGSISNMSWQWARSPNGRSGWQDIAGAMSNTYTAGADDSNQYLQATVSYEDRRGANKTASGALLTPIGDARPAANTAPVFSETGPVSRTAFTGTRAGRPVGGRVQATDADQGDVLTYSLSGTDADAFDIDATTGQIRTKAVLDHNTKDTYSVTVEVHDGFDGSYSPSTTGDATIDVTITVSIPSPPPPPPPPPSRQTERSTRGGGGGSLSPGFEQGPRITRIIIESILPGEDVGKPVVATDSRNRELTYTLSGDDAALFIVDENTGQIRVARDVTFDFESEQTRFEVELTATNANGDTDEIRVTIEVVNDPLPGIGDKYDADGNETIDLDEAIAALNDYFANEIDLDDALEVLRLYFEVQGATS